MGLDVVGSTKVLSVPCLLLVTARYTVNWCTLDSHVGWRGLAPAAPGTHKHLVVVPEIRFYPALVDYQNMYDVDI